MTTHLLMGALNKTTKLYEYPKIASKENKYICPDCEKDVILRKGDIRIHHFAHFKDENPCNYYNNPGESQIHKDAKFLFKSLLENKKIIYFNRKCNKCSCCSDEFLIKDYTDKSIILNEYRFLFNDKYKIADVAYLEDNKLKYIFEICYKHRTSSENRPEPWFEIDAESLIKDINTNSSDKISIKCIRNKTCEKCILMEVFREKIKKENEDKKKLEDLEKQRLLEIEKLRIEKRKLAEIKEEKLELQISEYRKQKGSEILKNIRSQHKRCSKCTSFNRCVKCVDKIFKKYNEEVHKIVLNIINQ